MLTVVTGPPCAGKSTYVRERAAAGDVVIDYDQLARALGSDHTHDHPAAVRRVARAARHAAITEAIACHRSGATVWVVDSRPSPSRRVQYDRAGAIYVHLNPGRAELRRRALLDGRRPATLRAIDTWADTGGPVPTTTSRPW